MSLVKINRNFSAIGEAFNSLKLDKSKGRAVNPMVNSGAIACTSLINRKASAADRFEQFISTWKRLTASPSVGFDNSTYLSERESADRNLAIAYFLREHGVFPPGTDVLRTLELYFQVCSISVTSRELAVAAATLANSGINPLTGSRCFKEKTVQNTLSLMLSSGVYDYSGEWAFRIGIPSKSGVSGALFAVIPNLGGICCYSPRLDDIGNSVRSVEFMTRLVSEFSLHIFDNLLHQGGLCGGKKNPRIRRKESKYHQQMVLLFSAAAGDLLEVQRILALDLDVDFADYDGRTALHVACAEGNDDVVQFLIDSGASPNPTDRWGFTPLDDALRYAHDSCAAMLRDAGGEQGASRIISAGENEDASDRVSSANKGK